MECINAHVRALIKSNLVSFALSPSEIDKISADLSSDIVDLIDNIIELQPTYVDKRRLP
jgi:hypothetical protein